MAKRPSKPKTSKKKPEKQYPRWVQLVFITPQGDRLHAGWRIILTLALLIALLAGFSFGLAPQIGEKIVNPYLALFITQAVGLVSIVAAVAIARRWLDRRSFASLGFEGLRPAWRDLAAGFGIPAAMVLLIFIPEWAFGWLNVAGPVWRYTSVGEASRDAFIMFLIFLGVTFQEGLLVRGYLLQNLAEGISNEDKSGPAIKHLVAAALLVTGAFGLYLMRNETYTWQGAAGAVLLGLLYAYAYIQTRQLWLPIGLHLGWNFFAGPVFGFPVNGNGVPSLLLQNAVLGSPEIITGGAFGPEAGLILLPALGLGLILVWYYAQITEVETSLPKKR